MTPAARSVLDAAGRMFYERGISAVAMEAVAEEAGVTKKTVYDRFGTKSALVAAYLRERDDAYRSWVEEWAREHPDTHPALAVFDALDSWMATRGPLGCAFVHAHAELLSEPEHPAHRIIGEQKTWLHAAFVSALGASRDAAPLATALLALHEGAMVLRSTSDAGDAIPAARAAAASLLGTRAS